jgi:A/G-specific adenine glycosylase
MMEIPSTPWEAKLPRDVVAPLTADWNKLKAPIEHTFTHFHLQLNVWKTATAEQSLPAGDGYRWVHKDELVHEALPSLMRKVVVAALDVPSRLRKAG